MTYEEAIGRGELCRALQKEVMEAVMFRERLEHAKLGSGAVACFVVYARPELDNATNAIEIHFGATIRRNVHPLSYSDGKVRVDNLTTDGAARYVELRAQVEAWIAGKGDFPKSRGDA